MAKSLATLTFTLFQIILFGLISAIVVLGTLTYDDLIHAVLQAIHRPDLEQVIRTTFFTENKYQCLQQIRWFLVSGLVVIALSGFLKRKKILAWLIEKYGHVFASMRGTYHELTACKSFIKWMLLVLLIAVVVRSVFLSYEYPMQYDEAWNYNYFLHQQGWNSMVAYNNYPLHNLVTYLFLKVLPDQTFTIRLPVMLFGVLTIISVFIILLKLLKNETQALLGAILFASLPVTTYYMLYARGVMPMLFFCWWAYYDVVRSFQKRFHPNRLALFHSLAAYTMVSYSLFPLITYSFSIFYFVIRKDYRQVIFQLRSLLLFIGCTALLYLPLFLGTGFSGGWQALQTSSNLNALHGWFYHNYSEFTTGHGYAFYMALMGALWMFFSKKYKPLQPLLLLQAVLLCIPFLFVIFQKSLPPERALAFIALPVVIMFVLFLQVFKKPNLGFLLLLPLIVATQAYTFQSNFLNWSKGLDHQVRELAMRFEEEKINSLYVHSNSFSYFIPGLLYYHHIHHKTLQIATSNRTSTRFQNPNTMPLYDALVLSPDSTVRFPVLFSCPDFVVYRKK